MERPQPEPVDIAERGARGQRSDRRLFVQFLAFTGCRETQQLVTALRQQPFEAVLYENVNDPTGVGLAVAGEDPTLFACDWRAFLQNSPFDRLTPLPDYTMFGRTYALGYEPDLEETLLHRPRRHLLEPNWPWAIWYPLRRKGAFTQLPEEEQRAILMEHGQIGFGFGRADIAHDIRLACHGLDRDDNDFVIGLFGKELAPLSIIVQTMRKTKQTSTWLEKLGPFFVGRVAWKQAGQEDK